MTIFEAALRSSTFTIHLLFAILCFRARRESLALRYCAFYALGCAAYVYSSAWPAPFPLNLGASVLMCMVPAAFWLLMGALCDDRFVPSRLKHAALAVMAAIGLAEGLTNWDQLWLVRLYFVGAIGFSIAGLLEAISGLMDDLVQSRRLFRLGIMLLAPLYAFSIIGAELAFPGISLHDAGRLVNSWGLAVPAWLGAVSFLQPYQPTFFTRSAPASQPADPREAAQLDRLKGLMEEERLYRDEGLSVASLAKRMGMAENRLRMLINTRLGHRNFSAFVNGYRLLDATTALSDPSQIEVPVLTIALDAGFGSIGPFNRAFKAETGMTPRNFRQTKLSIDQDSASLREIPARSVSPL